MAGEQGARARREHPERVADRGGGGGLVGTVDAWPLPNVEAASFVDYANSNAAALIASDSFFTAFGPVSAHDPRAPLRRGWIYGPPL
eukprot:CAMPEP_0118955960 /NCGR_PEP_ID=MMETSP1169-20130426/60811_1 /TAXON_ID=36882 /ORGANISM="Pyramimonas obovata, Strain CCMP722" /LENGTH=86 /DNA_ID=CAMNT_0006903895 /DNA_START=114 /DNA_END=372 /DNA_ORIENTATION=-